MSTIELNELTAEHLAKWWTASIVSDAGHTMQVWDAKKLPDFLGRDAPGQEMEHGTIQVHKLDAETLANVWARIASIDPQGNSRLIVGTF